jgi:hypothetical protein
MLETTKLDSNRSEPAVPTPQIPEHKARRAGSSRAEAPVQQTPSNL